MFLLILNLAHEDGIWCCAWRKGQEDGLNHIVTGAVDDLVKAWEWYVHLEGALFKIMVCILGRSLFKNKKTP